MDPRPSLARRVRKRINRRLYRGLFGFYQRLFPTLRHAGAVDAGAARRILVVQHWGVGDMILTTPLLSFLKDQLPRAEIDVLASPRNVAVIAGDSCVTRVYVNDHTWRAWLRVLPRLRARRYDVIFSGQAGRSLSEGVAASLIARRETYKVSTWRPKRYHGLFTRVVRVPPSIGHTRDRLLYMAARALGVTAVHPAGQQYAPRIAHDPGADAAVAAFREAHRLGAYIVVNLSAHFAVRDWEPEPCARFIALVLKRHPDLTVVLTRPPGRARPAEETAERCASPRVVLAPVMPLLGVAALIRGAVAVVTPDTAIVHVASACRRPVVALYAPQTRGEVGLWLPLGVPYRALRTGAGEAIGAITPERVAEAVAELLGDAASPSEATAVPAKG